MKWLSCILFASGALFSGEVSMYEAIASNPFVLAKDKVAELTAQYGVNTEQLLCKLVPIAKSFARPPISNYQAGVVGLGKSGRVYLGVNLELFGLPLHESVHAEQFLVTNARMHGEKELVAIALSAAPCGHCRQFLREMSPGNQLLIITPQSTKTLDSILPDSFGPEDLGLTAALMDVKVEIIPTANASLAERACQAALASYAPYSSSKSGVALEMKNGAIYTGSYLENVAFNPSLSPLQAALVALVIGKQQYSDIVRVILAEQMIAKISYGQATRHIVQTLAPDAVFETVRF